MDPSITPVVCAIALNAIFGNEPRISHRLLAALGSAEQVFALSERERLELFGPGNPRAARIGPAALEAALREYERLSAEGVRFLDLFSPGYPPLLRECPDAPLLLYVRCAGAAEELFGERPAVALVGTRDPSLYGLDCCRRIVQGLAQAPARPTVVSGLALGVDIAAHAAALSGGLPTVAVSPVGIEDVYPRRHRAFAERLAGSPGCALVTDYPPGTVPRPFNFLRRNRIIAGLAGATILVESRLRGGGMITARLAAGYGRDVFAVPGRIGDLRSQGCNQLIREQLAAPVTDPAALPAALGLGRVRPSRAADLAEAVRRRFGPALPPDEVERLVRLASAVQAQPGIRLDELCRETQLDYACVARGAGLLEEEDFIRIDLLQRCTTNAKNA